MNSIKPDIRSMVTEDYKQVIELWKNSEGVTLREADSKDGISKYIKRNANLSLVLEYEKKSLELFYSDLHK